MPADYRIDTKLRYIRLTYSGYVTIAEMYDARRRMIKDPAFNPEFSQLVDAGGATSTEMNGYTVKEFAKEHVFARSARRAIVVSRAPDVGLARMFQIYRELAGGRETIELFTDMEKAQRWLGLTGDGNG